MIENWTDLSEFLNHTHVYSSAPARLDCGGSTDHRLTALLCRCGQPATANIAINLRAHVSLRAYDAGRILFDIEGSGRQEFIAPQLPLTGPFALVSALIYYFGIHGMQIEIKTDFPFESGLGGSGAVAVAVIGAIYTALNHKAPERSQFPSIVRIAHHLEDSLFGNTGMQDQAAAVFGGANLWEWRYSADLEFNRRELATDVKSLSEHILLAYTGRPHAQSRNGSQMLGKFKETAALGLFLAISDEARRFAGLIKSGDYRGAGQSLTAEYNLRSRLLPVSVDGDLNLIEMAKKARCGVSVTGRGGGGCIWAIGEKQEIDHLKTQWASALSRRKMGLLLPVEVSREGLDIKLRQAEESAAARRRRHG